MTDSLVGDSPGDERGDPRFRAILDELWELHKEKSSTYGTSGDPYENFRVVSRTTGQMAFVYPWLRDVEKGQRVAGLIAQGRISAIEEFLDKAALNIIAEILRREEHAGHP